MDHFCLNKIRSVFYRKEPLFPKTKSVLTWVPLTWLNSERDGEYYTRRLALQDEYMQWASKFDSQLHGNYLVTSSIWITLFAGKYRLSFDTLKFPFFLSRSWSTGSKLQGFRIKNMICKPKKQYRRGLEKTMNDASCQRDSLSYFCVKTLLDRVDIFNIADELLVVAESSISSLFLQTLCFQSELKICEKLRFLTNFNVTSSMSIDLSANKDWLICCPKQIQSIFAELWYLPTDQNNDEL